MLTPTETTGTYVLQDTDILLGPLQPYAGYSLRVRDMDGPDRPREKLFSQGPEALDVAELVAVLWNVGTRREDVLSMARRTLHEYGEKAVGNERDPAQLAEVADIPLAKAGQLVAAFELGRRFHARANGRPLYIRNLDQASEYLLGMGYGSKEQLRGLYLNSRYRVVHDELISVGTLTSSVVHPREVFRPAIDHGAVAVIIAHNHPSGSIEPTEADMQVTARLKAVGELLGITLLDHLIMAADDCASIIGFEKYKEDSNE